MMPEVESKVESVEDEVYFVFEVRRSDVERRFAETGQPALPRSIELIGDCLRDIPVEALKQVILTELLNSITIATRQSLKQKEAERNEE